MKFGDVALFGASDAELEGGDGRTQGDVFHWREGAAAVAAEEEATGLICSEICWCGRDIVCIFGRRRRRVFMSIMRAKDTFHQICNGSQTEIRFPLL